MYNLLKTISLGNLGELEKWVNENDIKLRNLNSKLVWRIHTLKVYNKQFLNLVKENKIQEAISEIKSSEHLINSFPEYYKECESLLGSLAFLNNKSSPYEYYYSTLFWKINIRNIISDYAKISGIKEYQNHLLTVVKAGTIAIPQLCNYLDLIKSIIF